jgi:hypothetical protein
MSLTCFNIRRDQHLDMSVAVLDRLSGVGRNKVVDAGATRDNSFDTLELACRNDELELSPIL